MSFGPLIDVAKAQCTDKWACFLQWDGTSNSLQQFFLKQSVKPLKLSLKYIST